MADHHDAKGQNVKVVLRCRPMSSKELQSEKPVLKCIGDKHAEVMHNSLGKVAKRAFTFDGVFDEKTTQAQLYDNVARTVVDEVLQGYNCTVFAYGQTGTGKTFTMEGQVESNSKKEDAGIVPRAVEQVFKHLDENDIEYQVRISVVELYNEELSDLIAAADDTATGGNLRKLRLLEDPRKGVVLQGVEERPVNSAKDIFDILQGTNKQRKTAETLCNKTSSRSHSIFTLRIFMKEKTVDEEELIKTGTLNLVDLAGSECVGRSGAQGDRKKEAGQINQSLLTLGRVITALVDHQPHVPYRESKLTRLLQESLGGKTKTLIIATVSPSSANIEETLSTLDYACRAKAIKNTPEINQVQTKKTMMRELAKNIADLQEQLKSQREGNGVYLPSHKYEEMETELARLREIETSMQNELYEKVAQYKTLETAFNETKEALAHTEMALGVTTQELRDTEVILEDTKSTLQHTETTLHETSAVLTVTKDTGSSLYIEGRQVLEKSHVMKSDISQLFSKIDRHAATFDSNVDNVSRHKEEIDGHVTNAHRHLAQFNNDNTQRFKSLERMVAEFVVEKNEEMNNLQKQLVALQSTFTTHLDGSNEILTAHKNNMSAKSNGVANAALEHGTALRDTVANSVAHFESEACELSKSLAGAQDSVILWAQQTVQHLDSHKELSDDFASRHEADIVSVNDLVMEGVKRERDHLKVQKEALQSIVHMQQEEMQKMETDLTKRVQTMLSESFAQHHQSVSTRISQVMSVLDTCDLDMDGLSIATTKSLDTARKTREVLVQKLDGLSESYSEAAKSSQEGFNVRNQECCSHVEGLQRRWIEHQNNLHGLTDEYIEEAQQLAKGCETAAVEVEAQESERDQNVRKSQDKQNKTMVKTIKDAGSSGEKRGATMADALRDALSHAEQSYITFQSINTNLQHTNEALRLQALQPTGATPIKTDIALPQELPSFRTDIDIICEWHASNPNPDPPRLNPPFETLLSMSRQASCDIMSEHGDDQCITPCEASPCTNESPQTASAPSPEELYTAKEEEPAKEAALEPANTNVPATMLRAPSNVSAKSVSSVSSRGGRRPRSAKNDKENLVA